ncbi:hypothetical protein ACFPAF_16550 [Hymenobacter endophyticus]|uniref:Uncharacterized protein n=1 Tax=Hymenobacter endophyticus TaxID=3076335 RepID=A0ABU3TLE4_9BACT|nr:hypothetical protein [Hymenobacter endophyticus]MDU0372015.1 hypothetical protein [Hymenobacter endophyticus]
MTSTIKAILTGLVLSVFLIIGAVGYQLHDTNVELKNQINQRDSLIKRIQANDSLSCQSSEQYESTVTKYVTTDCSLLVDGKKISLESFIDIYVNQQQERLELQNQISKMGRSVAAVEKQIKIRELEYSISQDSLALYRGILRSAKNTYGLSFTIRQNSKYRYVVPESAQLDSAMILLRVFRRQLSYDSASRKWIVRHEVLRLPAPKSK